MEMDPRKRRHAISDDNGVLWSSDEYDAYEEGCRIMAAVDAGRNADYVDQIGVAWAGDLVLSVELARTR